jgi:predicted amidohydrolase
VRVLRVGLAQINPTVGDLDGNVAKVLEYTEQGRRLG